MRKWNISGEYVSGQDIIDVLLDIRGFSVPAEKELFLNPPSALQCVNLLGNDFKRALIQTRDLIRERISQNVPIVILGDYDSDGVCATAILYNSIKNELGYSSVYYFIPNRFDHGYGLSEKSIDAAVAAVSESTGGKPEKILFVTVDNGITAVKEVDYIKSLGYEVAITDHHQKPETLPDAAAILWSDLIVGAGVAWYLSKALGSKNRQSVALAAIATVTDLQPVRGANRSIVKEGLEVLNSDPPVGVKKLLDVAGKSRGDVTTYDLGWVIGPRLNASGRLVDASAALKLLCEVDEAICETLASDLNQINIERQDKTTEMYANAGQFDENNIPSIIISSKEDYHEGIIGLVAAKLVQKFHRPSIVISLSEDFGKGSVRSIPGVDIISVLRQYDRLFTSLGGHPMAAGFTIPKDNISELQELITSHCDENIDPELFVRSLDIDLKIPIDLVNLRFAEELSRLSPFGIGNKEPVFVSTNVGVSTVNVVGREGRHLSFRFMSAQNYYKGIFFNGVEELKEVPSLGDSVDIVYKVKTSEFNGNKNADLIIEDLRISTPSSF